MGLITAIARSIRIAAKKFEETCFRHQVDNIGPNMDIEIDELRRCQTESISNLAQMEYEVSNCEQKAAMLSDEITAAEKEAEQLVQSGDDENAREALVRKNRLEQNHDLMTASITSGQDSIKTIKSDIFDMDSELNSLEQRKAALCARGGVLKAKKRTNPLSERNVGNDRHLSKIERSISIKEREHEIIEELNPPVAASIAQEKVEKELAALKERAA